MRKAFTLVELMAVLMIISLLIAVLTTSVSRAQRRALMARADTEAREITNAILAYQNFDEDGSLQKYVMEDAEAGEGNLGFILGKVKARNSAVPVLYNAAISGGMIRDPWGHPYRITIRQGEHINPPGVNNLKIRLFYPNWHRLNGGDR